MPHIEFDQVTITTRRREAANLIAHFYRQKKALQPIYRAIREKLQTYREQKLGISVPRREKILDDIHQLDKTYLKKILAYQFKTDTILKRKLIVCMKCNHNGTGMFERKNPKRCYI